MARAKKSPKTGWKDFLIEQKSSLSSVFVALILIVLAGFLVFGLSQNNGKKETKSPSKQTNQAKNQTSKKDTNKETAKTNETKPYTVKEGDSLWKIAENFYQDGYKWVVIANENKLISPEVLTVGTLLTIPAISADQAAATTQPNTNNNQLTFYLVQKGDSLWSISQKFYSSGERWTKIQAVNEDEIGTLPNGNPLILPGTVLKIPPV